MHKIPVKIEGIERRKRSTGILHFVAGFLLITNTGNYFRLVNFEDLALSIPFYLVAGLSIVYGSFRTRFDPLAQYNHWIRLAQFLCFSLLIILSLHLFDTFQIVSLFLWSVITLFLMFTERKVFHDNFLILKGDGIHVPGYLIVNVIPWGIIENLVVRTDFVTILRRDEKYVQLEISHDLCSEEIEQINQFSQQQIIQFAPSAVQP